MMRQSVQSERENAPGFFRSVGESLAAGIRAVKDMIFMEEEELNEDMCQRADREEAAPGKVIPFTKEVLDEIRRTVGLYPAETGGLFTASPEGNCFDRFHFDTKARTNSAYFDYDVASCSEWMHERAKEGIRITSFTPIRCAVSVLPTTTSPQAWSTWTSLTWTNIIFRSSSRREMVAS